MTQAQWPMVSVIAPVRNRGELLSALLASLGRQEYPSDRLELLVMDNDSSEPIEEIVRQFARTARFRVLYFRVKCRHPASSRQAALGHAAGEVLAFIDSDCVASTQWLARGVQAIQAGHGLAQGMTLPDPAQPLRLLDHTVCVTREGPCYETCNVFYLAQAVRRVGGFSPEYERFGLYFGEDIDLAHKVKRAGYTSAFVPEALVYHHVFHLSLWRWATEPRHALTWPYIVRKFPEIRRQLFCRYFLTRRSACFDLLAVGVSGACIWHWALALLALPYLVIMAFEPGRAQRRYNIFLALARAVLTAPRAGCLMVLLIIGSIRFRSLLL